jgi:hypothetical protein
MNNPQIHIGELILQRLKEEKLSVRWLALKVKKDPSNLRRTLKKRSMDSDLLLNISEVLHYDFLQYYRSCKNYEVNLTSL